jgi:hypothetical protein
MYRNKINLRYLKRLGRGYSSSLESSLSAIRIKVYLGVLEDISENGIE